MSEKREITKPEPFTWLVQDNGTKEVFQSDPEEESIDPNRTDAFPVWNAPQIGALVDLASELLESLIALHAVASVECDEDYAAVTNAATVIAKGSRCINHAPTRIEDMTNGNSAGKRCSDCSEDGRCQMNCGPALRETAGYWAQRCHDKDQDEIRNPCICATTSNGARPTVALQVKKGTDPRKSHDNSLYVYGSDEAISHVRAALSVCADGGKGEAVGEIVGSENLHWARLFKEVPFGTKLYAAPQAACAPRANRDALYRKALAMGDAPDTIGPDTHAHNFEVEPSSGIELCTYCRMSRLAAKKAECAPREAQPEKNHIETMVHNAKIIQALHVARYALVTHSGCRVICEGVSRTMDFEPELNQVDEVMTMLGVDLTEPLPAPVEWDSKDGDDE